MMSAVAVGALGLSAADATSDVSKEMTPIEPLIIAVLASAGASGRRVTVKVPHAEVEIDK